MDSDHWWKHKHINAWRQRMSWIHCKIINCSNLLNILRDIKNALIHNYKLPIVKFKNYGTQRLNEPRRRFHLFCCNTWRLFEPSFNIDNTVVQYLLNWGLATPDLANRSNLFSFSSNWYKGQWRCSVNSQISQWPLITHYTTHTGRCQ